VLPPKETFPKAKEAIEKALAIDQRLAAAHASRAHIYLEFDYDWEAAEREYKLAIELDPRYAIGHHWYGGYLSAMGRHGEALEQAMLARELESVSLIINTWVGLRHYFAGRHAMAVEAIDHALDLDPNFAPAHWHLGWAYEQLGEFDSAIAAAEKAVAISKNPIYLASLGHAHAKAGHEQEARRILSELDQLALAQHVSAYHVAVIHAALGDMNNAFLWLERAYAERAPWIGYMRVDPRLDPLRSDARFESLLKQARLDF
jgi:tetratricopeptide (TPR) repeat protein